MAELFENLDGVGIPGLPEVFKWAVWGRVTGDRRRSPNRAPVDTVAPDLHRLKTDDDAPRALWIGHSTCLIRIAGRTFLTDPVLGHLGPIRRNVAPALDFDGLPDIDCVLISHNHRDHLDAPTIKRLENYDNVVAAEALGTWLTGQGCPAKDLRWWDTIEVHGVKITAVPAQHWSRRGVADTNRTHWCGFVLEADGQTAYYAGDTGYFRGFKLIGERWSDGFDLALLPIGAYDPEWFMSGQHQNPEEAGRAAQDIRARSTLAVHWGTFKLTDEPLDEPPVRAKDYWDAHHEAGKLKVVPIGGIAEGIRR